MATFTAILGLLVAYKAVLLPLLTALIGYLVPSPFQKAQQGQIDTKNAEDKATQTKGNVSDLDKLP